MASHTDKILAEKDGPIGWLTLNNPARRNALSLEMWEGIATVLGDFAGVPEIRVVVVRGAGDEDFASGADISQFEEARADADLAARYGEMVDAAHAAMAAFDKPLIAMLRGYALGGGLAIAMSADLRIAADDTRLGIPAARLGIPYGFAGLATLVGLVGPAHAKDLLITARRLTAAEGLRIGLVNQVVPVAGLEAAVRETCALIAANSPLSIAANMATVNEVMKDPADRDMARIDALAKACFDSADYEEGRRAFMEKRPPKWTGK